MADTRRPSSRYGAGSVWQTVAIAATAVLVALFWYGCFAMEFSDAKYRQRKAAERVAQVAEDAKVHTMLQGIDQLNPRYYSLFVDLQQHDPDRLLVVLQFHWNPAGYSDVSDTTTPVCQLIINQLMAMGINPRSRPLPIGVGATRYTGTYSPTGMPVTEYFGQTVYNPETDTIEFEPEPIRDWR